MTLTEYLEQKEPERMPKVILNEHEYIIKFQYKRFMINHGHERVEVKTVFINTFPSIEYVQVGTWNQLYTTDSDGNPKSKSCFWINN